VASGGGLGRREDALTSIEGAVQLDRDLSDRRPAFLEVLADSLVSLGMRLTEVGPLGQAANDLAIDLRELGYTEGAVAAELEQLLHE